MRRAWVVGWLLTVGCGAESAPTPPARDVPEEPAGDTAPGSSIQPQPQPGGAPYPRFHASEVGVHDVGAGFVELRGAVGATSYAVTVRAASLTAAALESRPVASDGSFVLRVRGALRDRYFVDVEAVNRGRGEVPAAFDVDARGKLVVPSECLGVITLVGEPAARVPLGVTSDCPDAVRLTPIVPTRQASAPPVDVAPGDVGVLDLALPTLPTSPFLVALQDGAGRGRLGVLVLPPPARP